MKKYKKFLMPLIVVVLLFSMALPSYAADYVKLKDLLKPDDGNTYFHVYTNNTDYTEQPVLYAQFLNENRLDMTGFIGNHIIVNVNREAEKGALLTAQYGDVLYFDFEQFRFGTYLDGGASSVSSNSNITLSIKLVLTSDQLNTQRTVTLYSSKPGYIANSNVGVYFMNNAFMYEFNNSFLDIQQIQIVIDYPEGVNDNFSYLEGYNIEFYVGSKEGAPIYGGADTSYLDDLKAQEDQLRSQTSRGVSEVNEIFDNLNGILTPASDMGEGAIAVTALLTPLFGMEPLDDILIISLAVGLIMFIIGTISTIHGSISASRRHTESAAYRETKGQYYREMINYYRNKRG